VLFVRRQYWVVVDDIEANRTLAARLLSADGHSVTVAEDGRAALQEHADPGCA